MTDDLHTASMAMHQALNAAIQQAGTERVIPCRLDPERWYPTYVRDAQAAIDACRQQCPIYELGVCRAYADKHGEKNGVWGGHWYGDRVREPPTCHLPECDHEVPHGRTRYCSGFCQREADLRAKRETERVRRARAVLVATG